MPNWRSQVHGSANLHDAEYYCLWRETKQNKTKLYCMIQTFDLNKMQLASMTEMEMQETDGGGFWGWVAGGVAALVEAPALVVVLGVAAVVDGAYEVGKGVVKGWNSVK